PLPAPACRRDLRREALAPFSWPQHTQPGRKLHSRPVHPAGLRAPYSNAMQGKARSSSLFAALSILAAPALAHDFWIEPSTYRPQPLQRFAVRLRVGNDFLGDPVPRDEALLVRFVAAGSDGERPVAGVHGRDPAGIAQAPTGGTFVMAYESRGSVAELTPDKMALYAEQEGVASQLPAGWQSRRLVR